LKPLTEKERLTRHCTYHPDRDDTFNCYAYDLPNKIFCPIAECKSVDEITSGVFLRHVRCEETSPFWDGKELVIPGEAHEGRILVSLDFGTGKDQSIYVRHWLFDVLRDLPRLGPEMWFPLMLLRATGESSGLSRVGRFVELAGAMAAGKTVLALQAMSPNGHAGRHVEVDNFIFTRRPDILAGRTYTSFAEILHLSDLLQRSNLKLFSPAGTPPGTRNMRVAFYRPSEEFGLQLNDGDRNVAGYTKRMFRLGWRKVERFFRDDLPASFKEIFGSQGVHPYWYTLALYDKSGESEEDADIMRDTLDKVAVVVNAAEIFGIKIVEDPKTGEKYATEKSIEVAVQRLRRAAERKQLCYLVVTQLDLVENQIGKADWATVRELADGLTNIGRDRGVFRRTWARLVPPRPSPAQQLLESWLGPQPTGNRRQLKERLKDVEEIFFIWTDDFPASRLPTKQDRLPTSHGLAKFVCRCLDIRWNQIGKESS
jgi:hypothetical protein